jgi:hypothetical protein
MTSCRKIHCRFCGQWTERNSQCKCGMDWQDYDTDEYYCISCGESLEENGRCLECGSQSSKCGVGMEEWK